ncbi:MAG: hypothetical protein DRJ66_03285 [Thermoprotei archaeon]|nr:MAG: hypothetical protein DRJ66_03285 [Thermoprotei archaeon]
MDDFERDQLWIPRKKGKFSGWRVTEIDDGIKGGAEIVRGISFSGDRSMRIWAKSSDSRSDWGSLRVDFSTRGKRHQRSLMTGISLSMAIMPACGIGENGRLRIHIRLSQRPPDFTEESIIYITWKV